MGPQMFFLAISNNIPMFTDALASARKEYEALTAAGKKATPVWKQTLSSLFSWQTAMATAITLSVVYGKEIGNFFSQIVKGKNTLTDLADAQVKVNESMDAADLSKKIITIRSLQDRWNELGDNLKEKKEFIKYVEFNVTYAALEKALQIDIKSHEENAEVKISWIDLLAYLGAKYGGDFSKYQSSDMDTLVDKLQSGETMESLSE